MMRWILSVFVIVCLAWAQEPQTPTDANAAATGADHSAPAPSSDHQSGAEHAEAAVEHGEGHEGGTPNEIWWKWANFAILAIALGWLISKNAGPFFRSRTAAIQQGIAEASQMKAEADARADAIERRLASLETEVEALRRSAHQEIEAEGLRVRHETEQQLVRIQAHAEQEIASAAKTASEGLKAHAAELALKLAEEQLRNRLTPETQTGLVRSFVRELGTKGPGNGKGSVN